MLRTAAAILLALTAPASAQDLTRTAPPQSVPVYITGATAHTVTGGVIENSVIAFEDGRITLVGSAAEVLPAMLIPAEATVIDATGKHAYPGLIAPATTLGLTEIAAVRATRDHTETGDFTPEVRAASAVNPDSTLIPVARSNGILLFGSFPTGGRVPGRASVMRAEGWTWEDMTVADDAGLIVTWPSVRAGYSRFGERDAAEQAQRLRDDMDELDAFFDAAEAYHAARAADPGHPADIRLGAMARVLPGDGQRPVFINANDADQITSAVAWCVKRSLKPVIVGGRDAALCAALLAEHDVPVILRGTHVTPKRSDSPYDEPFTTPATLQAAGVRWCMDSADRDGNVRNLPYEAGRAAAFGLDPAAALRSLTLSTAEILGIAADYGSIEVGKSATLFLASGDCLEVTTTIEAAFIDGRAIDLSNKQTHLRDKYREKYRQLGIIKDD